MAFTYTLKYSIKYKAMTSRFSQDMVRKKKTCHFFLQCLLSRTFVRDHHGEWFKQNFCLLNLVLPCTLTKY